MTTELSTHVGTGALWNNTSKTIEADFGAIAGKVTQGNDSRLTDSRAPTGAAGGDLGGTYPNPSVAKITTTTGPTSLTVGAIADAQVLARSSTSVVGVTIGSGAGTICAGNDSRLSDDRTGSGLRSATTVVVVSAAAAPSSGQVLQASSGTAAAWVAPLAVTSTAPADVTKAAAAVGVATDAARRDHKHDISTAAASANPPGTSSAEGTATSLARSDHAHTLAAFGTGSGTFCQGNDSRLSDDRTGSGLRSATTVVSVSGATAPSSGQVLTATASTTATWQTPASSTLPAYQFFADQLDSPVTADWAVNSVAAASSCTNNSALTVRRFVDASEDGVGFTLLTPTGATNIVFSFVSRAEVAPGSTLNVVPKVYVREFQDNTAPESWSAGTLMTALAFPTNENWQYDSQTIALSTLSMVAGRVFQCEITRAGADGSDTLTTDWTLLMLGVAFT